MKKTKQALGLSLVSLLLCISMLVGTTFAWFTDSVTAGNNIIKTGNLDVAMYWTDDLSANNWRNAETEADGVPFDYDNWEPGYTEVRYVKVANEGKLALKYALSLGSLGQVGKLAEVIGVYYSAGVTANIADRSLGGMTSLGYLVDAVNGGKAAEGALLPGEEIVVAVALHMDELAGNEYQQQSVGDGFVFKLVATQAVYESDSFDNQYDTDALFPELEGGSVGVSVKDKVDADNKLTEDVILTSEDGKISATVPAGTLLNAGVQSLQFSVTPKAGTDSNVTLEENEVLSAWDVHIEGLAANNTVPALVTVEKAMSTGLNIGNYAIYHVENGQTVKMTAGDLTVHNGFTYDPATGDVVLALASFSEVALVAEPAKWEGEFDYSWYNADATEMTIANADQLAGFGAIVGGMDGQAADDFVGKTVKLVCNIVIGDLTDEDGRNVMFYPVGYYNTTESYTKQAGVEVTSGFKNFSGTFDGNGHTVSDFYQNTWEAFGDYNDGYSGTPNYYRDGFGLFGRVYGGTVKNLTVKNFSSDGEFTTTGTIAAYAEGATFENIAIFNCNPRVYNIGNGGIVGCVGWYAKEAGLKTTFKNITVDNTNKISALWGSWDVACGGIVGQYYPTSGQTSANKPANGGVHFENCHVAAQIDVYNDVCANYQYYAYRYAGILLGSVRENVTIDGHEYPDMTGITASGCTVHFGDWNDYYYCELVANSLASYTHDHQMSRLVQVAKVEGNIVTYLDGSTETVTGTRNFVVVKAKDANGMWVHGDGHDYADCYHFVNGAVWTHDMAGTETVDGQTVLKEDKQVVYREFNNLVTGYGWGVTSKGVEDMDGVTILDREEGNSVVKFEGTGVTEYELNTPIKIGDLFDLIDTGVELKKEVLSVTITDLDNKDGISTSTFERNTDNWEDGVLTISGKGRIAITIQDYYFCEPKTIELNIVDPMQSMYVDATTLYAVGQSISINSVSVSYKYGTRTVLAADEYTIENYDFSKSGIKKITISYTELGHTITKTFDVNVVDAFNALIVEPKKNAYELGTELKASDFNVTVVDSNGRPTAISGYEVSAVDTSTVGKKTVTISFTNPSGNKVTSATCEVLIMKLENISDEVTQYWFFESNFNVSGWSDYTQHVGTTYTAPNGEIVTGFDTSYTQVSNNGATQYGFSAVNGEGRYDLVIVDALPYTTLGINCSAGYSKPLIGFGYYIDGDLSTLKYDAPAIVYNETNNPDAYGLFGEYNGHALTAMDCNDFAPGSTHTVYWVAVFAEGVKDIGQWTVRMKADEQNNGVFVDTDKPNANVIIMAGQSNMFGASPITQTVRDKYENFDFSNVYIHYNNINATVENGVANGQVLQTYFSNDGFYKYQLGIGGQADSYFGPEAALAYYLSTTEGFSNQQWYIIKYAAAGTGLAAQWMSSCTVNGKTTTLTDDMITYVQNAIAGLEDDGFDVQIHSFLWMQGETDASDITWAESYAANEKALVSRVRNAFAKNATRYAGDASVPGSGIAFINAGIAVNDIKTDVANGGPNDWKYANTVNDAKISNSQQLCSIPGYNAALAGGSLNAGPLAGLTFVANGVATPTIVNPDRKDAIVNSVYIDTHYLLSKLNSTDEHAEYAEGDRTDWAHYGAVSMNALGELFASCHHYMMITGPVESVKFTVSFDSTGGEAIGDMSASENSYITLPAIDRDGYILKGWYTAASGGTKVGDAGVSYKVTGNVTLYAQWTEVPKVQYTVTYNANGGSVTTTSQSVNAGESIYLPTPTRNNYDFNGWYTAANGGTKVGDAGASYTPTADITLYAQWSYNGGCVTPDTLITLADGTQKEIQYVTSGDMLLVWDFYNGEYTAMPSTIVMNHGYDFYEVVTLNFSNGTTVNTINGHGFFDIEENKFVIINKNNVADYIGHSFTKDAATETVATLESYSIKSEYTESWSVLTAVHYNCVLEGMLTITPAEVEGSPEYLMPFVIGDDMKYDEAKMQADIETYGLYTYDDFAEYMAYEQFVGLGLANFKVSVAKGYITWDDIVYLISIHIG